MRKTQLTVSVPQVIKVGEYEANVNVLFKSYGSPVPHYYAGVAQVAKATAAILKAAGFTVISSSSQSYSGGESVNVTIKSELTDAQKLANDELIHGATFRGMNHPDYHREPREALAYRIEKSFESGSFDGMQDLYEYRTDRLQVTAPDGTLSDLSAKYVFFRFE